jgi:type IV pilus assembly protein PilM
MRPGLRSRPWVGLDAGTYSVKIVASHGGVGGARYWCAEAPLMGLRDEIDPKVSPERIAQAIAQCLDQGGASARALKGISLGISGQGVIIKQIALPLLDESEVGPALRFEARKHLPFDPQTMIIDYQILARFPTERKLEVLLAAVGREHAERQLEPLKILGVEPDILDATPLALANAVVQGVELGSEAQVLLDIGKASSHLTVYQRGQPFFARRFDFGGRNITRAVAVDTDVPFEEAEEWKLALGGEKPGFRVDWSSAEMQAVQDCLRRELVEELHRTFAFYRTQAQLGELSRLWVSGGAARLPGLADRLGELLGVPVTLFDPLANAPVAENGGAAGGPQFAQAFGLSLRTA